MFTVIYRSYIKAGLEAKYLTHWQVIANYFVNERGALGSTLHKGEDGIWIAYSKWPDKATRDASWPSDDDEINPDFPLYIQEAIKGLRICLDPDKALPEIHMQLIQEIKK